MPIGLRNSIIAVHFSHFEREETGRRPDESGVSTPVVSFVVAARILLTVGE
jgi:hypothetical protein